jgi:hypothetical protein
MIMGGIGCQFRKSHATVILFLERIGLDHGAHCPIEDQDAFFEQLIQDGQAAGYACL